MNPGLMARIEEPLGVAALLVQYQGSPILNNILEKIASLIQ